MMHERIYGQDPAVGTEVVKEGRSAEEIREIIRTIESYLEQTKAGIERIERFMKELKEDAVRAEGKEREKETDEIKGRRKEDMAPGI